MIAYKFHLIFLALVQQVPPPPNATAKSGPTPPGDAIPLDTDIWLLLIMAVAIIIYVTMPKVKRSLKDS